ncbi:sugar ABC transporter ATP-binding protein [Phytoactinopolyspora alkaliphila]|uniref:Sugar ABC transporter ATP-binding protein n=1 Tax=Phytoactinopolyspora alkaliphila TaxID=1783498 RepID=A0A6N9YQV5_9ACTN|nr:sugar ABC transporter ATP-binding protein [Phytoactinopolyspora alkaliphila]
MSSALAVEKLTKHFGATTALDQVSLQVAPGRVHALIGLNGSGKSTLVKCLSGFLEPDSGTVLSEESAFVHQDLGLASSLSVTENFVLGRPPVMRGLRIDRRAERELARRALAPVGLADRLDHPVSALSTAERVVLAIARALDGTTTSASSALVLDEPTSALPADEIGIVTRAIREHAGRGMGILFITHRLQEVCDLADDVSVLRDGQLVHSGPVGDMSIADLVATMTGTRTRAAAPPARSGPRGEPVLHATSLSGRQIQDVDLTLHAGEIVGVFGMLGSGVEELGGLLAGRERPASGRVDLVDGAGHARRAGAIGYIPSDRPNKAVLPGLSVRENLCLPSLRGLVRRGRIDRSREHALARRLVTDMGVQPRDHGAAILALSGGNQQKVVLGRWLAVAPPAIVAEEITQGVDVPAKEDLLAQVRAYAARGGAVALLALEPEEVLSTCDRVVVLRHGRLVDAAPRSQTSVSEVLAAMHGTGDDLP